MTDQFHHEQIYLQAVSSQPLSNHTQLPLGVTDVLPQGCQKEVTLAAGYEEGTRQTEEAIQRVTADSGQLETKLLGTGRAELVP